MPSFQPTPHRTCPQRAVSSPELLGERANEPCVDLASQLGRQAIAKLPQWFEESAVLAGAFEIGDRSLARLEQVLKPAPPFVIHLGQPVRPGLPESVGLQFLGDLALAPPSFVLANTAAP